MLVASLLVLTSPTADAANCGGSTTCSCGDTVISDYTLPNVLDCSGPSDESSPGLIIGASDIVLDCVSAGGVTGGDVSGVNGIIVEGVHDVTLVNCGTKHFDIGLRVHDAYNISVLEHVSEANLKYGMEISDDGATSPDTTNVVVFGGLFRDSGDEGLHVSGRAGVNPGHTIKGSAFVDNICEGLYVLNIAGTSMAPGIGVSRNVFFGNGQGDGGINCNTGAAGLFIDTVAYSSFRYNSLTHDNVELRDSSNVTLNNVVVNFGRVKLNNSDNNVLGRVCVQGNGVTPGESFLLDDSDDNTCTACVASKPVDYHVKAQNGSTGNSWSNVRISPDTGAEWSTSVDGTSNFTALSYTATGMLPCMM